MSVSASMDRMPLVQAKAAAAEMLGQLAPFCERIEVAGSVRRERASCKDVEIVAIPREFLVPALFGGEERERDRGFVALVNGWERVKGEARDGRYMQRRVPVNGSVFTLDLFLATPENWGLILAIRTGSADYSRDVLACGWVKAGYHSKGGMLRTPEGIAVPVREEGDLFKLIGVPWCEPRDREIPEARR